MAKSKPKKSAKQPPTVAPKVVSQHVSKEEQSEANARWWREAVESIVVAIVLALLFRTFEAEAFVIPTGSMAPTLQGRHKDVVCDQCGYPYRGGASEESEAHGNLIWATVCPMCRYPMELKPQQDRNHDSFTGDRILVNKFVYQFADPERWDVIVFKFPGNAKQNYIKRLVGLPGETLRVWHGDIYTQGDGEDTFSIQRKPPRKLTRMLQLVHDTDYASPALIKVGWPARWQTPKTSPNDSVTGGWKVSEDRKTYRLDQNGSQNEAWLRYRHIVPTAEDWLTSIEAGQLPEDVLDRRGELISDFYAYNAPIHRGDVSPEKSGQHWVGDLAVECELEVLGDSGEVVLDLVEGGRHFSCRLNVADGKATLMIDGGQIPFSSQASDDPPYRLAQTTKVRGPGSYKLRFANVDNQLLLWVDDSLVQFGGPDAQAPGGFELPSDNGPQWSPTDPGDLAPVGIGGKNIALEVNRLRVLRDVYYVATSNRSLTNSSLDYKTRYSLAEIRQIFRRPELWAQTGLFASRRHEDFELGADQFFPMGDNSPQSKDARLWSQDFNPQVGSFVERDLLTGKAFLIYWPHPWYAGTRWLPIVPDVRRMGLIR